MLVLLRGFPGYQCPYCVKQMHDFVEHSADFAAKKVTVLLVYPEPPADLDQHAKEFLAKQSDLPPNTKLVIDPDYKMTNLYGLRWDAPHETAYPSTFILDKNGKILFQKISHSHGDRTSAEEVLGAAEDDLARPIPGYCARLLFKHLQHELRLNLIQLHQRHLQSLPVFIRCCAEDVFEAKGGALHQHFRVL